MLLPLPWLCSRSPSSSEEDNTPAAQKPDITALTPAISVLTHPSLPSLTPPLNPSPPLSASFLCLSSLSKPSSTSSAPSLAISPSPLLLYSANESLISVYDLIDLRLVDALPAPPAAGASKSISLAPNASALFTAHQDGRIRVWRRSPRSGLHRLVTSLPTASDRLLRFPNPNNHVTIRRHHKRLWIEHADAVSGIVAAASGKILYSVSWDKTMKVWSVSGLRCLESVLAHEDAVNAVVVGGDGRVYTGSADGRIRVWARVGGGKKHELVGTLERHRSGVNALALSGDGMVLYSGACDRSVLVWEREEKVGCMRVTGALRGHERAILALACEGEIVVSGCGDGGVRVWRRDGGRRRYECLAVMEGHVKGVRSLGVVRMGVAGEEEEEEEEFRVCSGSLDGEVRVWRVRVFSL